MAGERKPKNLKRRLIGLAGSLISLAVLTYIAVTLISGRPLNPFGIFGLFSGDDAEIAGEYHFDVGRARVFAGLNDSVAAAGTLGIQVLDAGGNETLRDSLRMSKPAISEMNGRAIAFDIGGTAARIFNDTENIAAIDAAGAIIAASINRNGWFTVCTQDSGAANSVVTAYNNSGNNVYRVTLASGYVLSAELSPDNKSLAILNLADNGSRISYYDLNSEDLSRAIDLPGGIILDIRYLANGEIIAVSTKSLLLAGKNGEFKELYVFSGRQLGGYSIDADAVALYLLDYSVGHRGRLITLDKDGTLLGELETDREIISMSLSGEYLAILRSDGLSVCNAALEELPAPAEAAGAAGAVNVLILDGDRALAAGDHSAIALTIMQNA